MPSTAVPAFADLAAAVIDLDGTLVDTLGDFEAALNAMLAELALPAIDAAFVARSVGKGSEYLVERTLAQVGAEPSRFDEAFDSYQRHYGTFNGRRSAVYPGVVEGLDKLAARGLRLACLTNKPTRFATALLDALGIGKRFELCFGGDAFERKKPDPLPLRKTCEALGLPPARVLMVGDSRNDAEAAHGAGCPVALVSYGFNHGEPVREVPADAYVDRLDELPL